MKMKIIATVVSTFLSVTIYAQVPFVHYEVVPNYQVNSQGVIEPIQGNPFQQNNTANSRNAKPQYPVIGAYFVDSNNNLKRIKIQVNSVSDSFGKATIYLRGTYNSTHSMWNPCNTQAVKVDEYMDNEFVVNNFEWKVDNAVYGTIYFNF